MKLFSFSSLLLVASVLSVTADPNTAGCPPATIGRFSQKQLTAAMQDFGKTFFYKRDVVGAFNKYVAAKVVVHDQDLPDGRDAVVRSVFGLFNNPRTAFEVKKVVANKDYALVLVDAVFAGGAKQLLWALFRVEGLCVVETWDIWQAQKKDTISLHPYF